MSRPETSIPVFAMLLVSAGILGFSLALLARTKVVPGRDMEVGRVWTGRADAAWRLRPSDHGSGAPFEPSGLRLRLAEEIPDERRFVRVVYSGLTGPR